MRTTVNVNDQLLSAAKEMAARTHRSLGAVIDDALRALLRGDDPSTRPRSRVVLPTDGGSGLQPGVDLDDRGAVADLLDEPPSRHVAS